MKVDLSRFDNSWYSPGRGYLVRILWHFINAIFLQSPLNPSSGLKTFFLRLFGAKIGKGVVFKPSINVKYPWNLEVGSYSWIGENTWMDCLAPIKIGNNCCVSQGAYLLTGNHNYKKVTFDLILKEIILEDGVWVGARALICPGVRLGTHSIISAGSVVDKDTESYTIYKGNPAISIRERNIGE